MKIVKHIGIVIFTLMGMFVVMSFASSVYAETPVTSGISGSLFNNTDWSGYTMGFRFKPNVNGQITALRAYSTCSGTARTVKLYSDAGALITSASVTQNGGWAQASITPVNLTAGTYYRIGVYPSSCASYYNPPSPTFPATIGNITIDAGTYSSGDASPSTWTETTLLRGFPDFDFSLPNINVGYDSIGASTQGSSNRLRVSRITVPAGGAGLVSSGKMYIDGATANATVYMIVYSGSGINAPTSLLGVSNGVSVLSTDAPAWLNFTFPTPFSISDAQDIWIGLYADTAGTTGGTGGPLVYYSGSVVGNYASDGYRWADLGDAPVPGTFPAHTDNATQLSYSAYLIPVPNTAPTITVNPTSSYGSYTRTGSLNTPFTVNFTATDTQQTGANALTYTLKRSSDNATIGAVTGTFTSGAAQNISVAYNATNLAAGTNTLYMAVSDGSLTTNSSTFTALRDDGNSSVAGISHNPNPVTVSNQYTVTFTPSDTYSTSGSELRWWIRTSTGGGGTQLSSGSTTSGNQVTTGTITDAALANGANTRYVRVCDGANNCSDTSFTVTKVGSPTVASPTNSPASYTTITLGGNVTADGGFPVTERGVCYSTTDSTPQLAEGGVTCAAALAGGTGVFTVDITDLTPNNTLYHYRAYATNSQGTSYTSTDTTFNTLTYTAPAIVIQAPTNPTSSSITLNATANPNSSATTAYFRVWEYSPFGCLDGGGTRWPTAGGTGLTGSTAQTFTEDITGLIPNKTYYYCAIATNSGGTNYHSGTPSTFTTPNGPQTSCDGSPTSTIIIAGTADCSFPGSGNITGADGSAMTFQSGANFTIQAGQTIVFTTISKAGATINKVAGGVMRKGYIWVKDTDGDGFYDRSSVQFSASPITPPGAGYVRRSTLVGASYLSQAGECNDSSNTVTVADCKPAGTAPNGVTNLTSTAATLNGVTNPNGDAGTRAYFKWGTTNTGDCDTLASSTSATLLSGASSQSYSANISGLSNLTTYYWCTIVYNNEGTSYGNIDSFVAQNSAPSISLGSPASQSVTATTVTLNFNITSDGGSAVTARGSCWGTSPSPVTNCLNDGLTSTGAFSHARTGLTAGTLIYFRGRAINALGTNYSSDSSFTTPPAAPTLNTVTSNTIFNRSDLSWNAPTGATGYYVKWCKDAACTPNSTGSAFGVINVGNVTSYQHSHGNTCGAVMRYIVYAEGVGGNSADSSTQQVTTLCPPTIGTITADSSSQLTVNYTPASGATGHTVFRCTPSVCTATVQVNTDNATSPYVDTGLSTNTGYSYRLKTTSANATSDYSNTGSQTTQNCTNTTYYRDLDGDTYGNPSVTQVFCVPGANTSGYVANNNDCDDSTGTIILGSTRTRYQSSAVSCGTACASQVQTCQAGGTWSGTYTGTSCTASTRTRYAALTSACGTYGSTSEVQSCQTNGTWNGTYTLSSPPSASTRTRYLSSCAASCSSEVQTCQSSGSWNGTYSNASCSISTTYYRDNDSDGYGKATSGTTTSCTGAPGGYSSLSTDCYDGNASFTNSELAYPGSGTWSVVDRGDGSFDYNCDLAQTLLYQQGHTFGATPVGTCIARPAGVVGYATTPCSCGSYCWLRVCGMWSTSACGTWGGAIGVTTTLGQTCPSGGGGWAVGDDYGQLQQVCN